MLAEPGYQIGIAKLEDGRVAVFFAFTDDQMIRPKDPAEYLREKFGHLGVYVPEILDAADQIDDIYYDWMAQIELPKWHKNRVVLIGDACYAVSLLAGQGASMAVGGAEVLASYIGDGDIDGGLDRFEAAMKPDIAKKQAAGRKNAKWMVPTSKFHLWVRNVFLKLIGLPGLSHLLRWFLAASIKSLPRNE